MLQRKQSLYLLIVFVLSIFLFTGPLAFVQLDNGGLYLKHSGVTDLDGNKLDIATWPLTVMISISTLLSFLTIFSYMNRARQMRLTLFLMFFNLGLIVLALYYAMHLMHNYNGVGYVFQWRVVIPPVMLVLLILAFLGIRKDDLLVKAADRIRK